MPATLADIYNAVVANGALHARFTAAVIKAAGAVRVEDPGTPSHTERLAWSTYVLTALDNAKAKAQMIALLSLAGNGDLQSQGDAAADSLLEYLTAVYLNQSL